ncbi:aromatic ring-hydroxylating dioxygenase subunit alpha [Thalassobaculum sp.]|uniref:aromatic ring-hydroxylating dioxygenase subunit alpha n=1 Tax=Thalassobaculum sp. TaxID=2022740 RepID=UPI0032EBFAD0
MSASLRSDTQRADDTFLRDIWYFALPSAELGRGALRSKTLLGEPVLFGRDDSGAVFAMRDICPHRGIPLSDGRFDQGEVECCYHGWRFGTDGRCTAIPSLTTDQAMDVDKIRVRTYPVVDRHGAIWIYMPADPRSIAEPAVPPPVLPDVTSRAPGLVQRMSFPCHIDHAVIGLMDPAHGPFVHTSWWWRSRKSIHEKAKRFGPVDLGFAMLRHQPSSNSAAYRLLGGAPTTEIRFHLPGIRVEDIEIGRHRVCGLTAVTPVDATTTEIHQLMFWSIPWLSVLRPVLAPFVRRFLAQDRDVVVRQQRGLAHNPTLMLINDADVQAKWYFRLKKAYAAWRADGVPFENPVRETTLRWRS